MKRSGAIVLFAGAVLISTHILAPAAPPPAAAVVRAADLAALAQDAPIAQQVDAQVNRLRERLANPPAYPPPTRDPFRFGQRADAKRPATAALAPAIVAEPPAAAAAPTLPKLVAIATSATDGGSIRTAVLALADDIQIVKAGDVFSKLSVSTILSDAVELIDPTSGQTFRILLH